MLSKNPIHAFVPTMKSQEAKTFYKDVLGLELTSEDEFALEFQITGGFLRVTKVQDFKPHPFTVFGWMVEDVALIVIQLNEKNIFCERYGFIEQDDLGIWTAPNGTKIAWFKDPDGNLLSVND
jgi:predicted enzyme related to lactoylglutathione lyase